MERPANLYEHCGAQEAEKRLSRRQTQKRKSGEGHKDRFKRLKKGLNEVIALNPGGGEKTIPERVFARPLGASEMLWENHGVKALPCRLDNLKKKGMVDVLRGKQSDPIVRLIGFEHSEMIKRTNALDKASVRNRGRERRFHPKRRGLDVQQREEK